MFYFILVWLFTVALWIQGSKKQHEVMFCLALAFSGMSHNYSTFSKNLSQRWAAFAQAMQQLGAQHPSAE